MKMWVNALRMNNILNNFDNLNLFRISMEFVNEFGGCPVDDDYMDKFLTFLVQNKCDGVYSEVFNIGLESLGSADLLIPKVKVQYLNLVPGIWLNASGEQLDNIKKLSDAANSEYKAANKKYLRINLILEDPAGFWYIEEFRYTYSIFMAGSVMIELFTHHLLDMYLN